MTITAQMVKELRDRTGAGFKECKEVLTETGGDVKQAIELLKEKGLKDAGKKVDRDTREGRVEIYVHAGARMAAMVELDCETDFVARTDDFMTLSRDIALHVAATNPRFIRSEEVPAEDVTASGLDAEKYYAEVALLSQPYIKDPSQTIGEKLQAAIARLGENIVVRRFVRYEVGG